MPLSTEALKTIAAGVEKITAAAEHAGGATSVLEKGAATAEKESGIFSKIFKYAKSLTKTTVKGAAAGAAIEGGEKIAASLSGNDNNTENDNASTGVGPSNTNPTHNPGANSPAGRIDLPSITPAEDIAQGVDVNSFSDTRGVKGSWGDAGGESVSNRKLNRIITILESILSVEKRNISVMGTGFKNVENAIYASFSAQANRDQTQQLENNSSGGGGNFFGSSSINPGKLAMRSLKGLGVAALGAFTAGALIEGYKNVKDHSHEDTKKENTKKESSRELVSEYTNQIDKYESKHGHNKDPWIDTLINAIIQSTALINSKTPNARPFDVVSVEKEATRLVEKARSDKNPTQAMEKILTEIRDAVKENNGSSFETSFVKANPVSDTDSTFLRNRKELENPWNPANMGLAFMNSGAHLGGILPYRGTGLGSDGWVANNNKATTLVSDFAWQGVLTGGIAKGLQGSVFSMKTLEAMSKGRKFAYGATAFGTDQLASFLFSEHSGDIEDQTPNKEKHSERISRRKLTPEVVAKVKKAIAFFQSKGWSREQAEGIVSNLLVESNYTLDPHQGQIGGGGGYGIAQWTSKDRKKQFANTEGVSLEHSTFEQQLDFVNWELNHTEKKAHDKLKSANTISDASKAVTRYYERPKEINQQSEFRAAYGEGLFKQFDTESLKPQTQIASTVGPSSPINVSQGGTNISRNTTIQSATAAAPSFLQDSVASSI